MSQQEFSSPEEAIQHYGVKGMHWGVRKESGSGGGHGNTATVAARKTAQSTVVLGAAAAGRALGYSVGGDLGSLVGSFMAAGLASKVVSAPQRAKSEAAFKDLAKAVPNRHPKYTDRMVKSDIRSMGVDGANRINDSMNAGKTRSQASDNERRLQTRSSMITVGTSVAETLLAGTVGRTAVNNFGNYTGNRAAANRAARARNATKNTSPTPPKPAKNRQGAFNITTLKR
jgi:hypothetical protein